MPTQIIGGKPYEQYSPSWYDAQKNESINAAGVKGTAEGTGESNYLRQLSPSLAGLYATVNGGGSQGGGSFSTPNTVQYPTSTFAPSGVGSVSADGLMGGFSAGNTPDAMTIAPVDLTKANTAAFATAKDQAANTAQASLTGLRSALQSRGMGGAGYEAGQIGSTLAREANTIGAASRDEARNEANLQAEQSIANLNAGVTQRGQTIGARESAANRELSAREAAFTGGIAQRGQDVSAQEGAAGRAADAAGRDYSGSIAQRAQDIDAATSAADRAQREAALKSNQTLAILQAVMGGRSGRSYGAQGYVY